MKIAVDCRMSKKSGIGAFIDGILPYFFSSNNDFLLIFSNENKDFSLPQLSNSEKKIEKVFCDTKIFTLKELFNFPKEIVKKINSCDAYFSPYFNIPSKIKIPVYTTIHDVVFLDIPSLAGKCGTLIRKMFYKYAVKKSKEIFTVSNFSKERIIKNLNCKKNINVVYSALPEFFNEKSSDIQKDNSIIFIGNIKKHKGLSTLIPAFSKFLNILQTDFKTEAKLIIVGSRENFKTTDNSIENLLKTIPKAAIDFTGNISNSELKEKLSKAKFLIQPSLYEGFGLPPLQALYSNTNVILSDIEVFKEIYEGFPVTFFKSECVEDLTEKMIQMWNNPYEIKNIPEKYSFSKTAEKILSKIEENYSKNSRV